MTGGTIAVMMLLAYVVWVFWADLTAKKDDDDSLERDDR